MNHRTSSAPASSGLASGWLLGSWEVTGSTSGIALPDPSYHHFDASGRYFLELAFGAGGMTQWIESIYRAQHDGFWTSFDPSKRPHVSAWYSRFVPCTRSFDEIIITGHSGDGWWLRRLERPAGFLKLFVDPMTGRLSRREEMAGQSQPARIPA